MRWSVCLGFEPQIGVHSLGSTPPLMPRYTFSALVSWPSLTMALLITCSVVVYRLPWHRDSKASAMNLISDLKPRSTPLYLRKRGPV